ncbi:MAG: type pilus assembly protein PilM [Miltoncostaeaceae bacterium]|nr:type pilus assembly protein PilM [Miltoncostaeaceae bacterium]
MSTVVALDIGSSALAGVELTTGHDRPSLVKAAIEPLREGLVVDGEVADPDGLAAEIKRFWRAQHFSGRRVRLGVANQRVSVRTIEMPAIDDPQERRAAVEFESAEHVPIPADQAIVDFVPVARFETEGGMRERIVLAAAHSDMIGALTKAVQKAGLQPVGVDLEAFALLRALLPLEGPGQGGSAPPAWAICHVGAATTNLIVAVGHECQLTRLVGFGGTDLTRAVSDLAGLPPEEAEALKRACGLLGEDDGEEGWDRETAAKVRRALALGARPLAQEVARSLDYYRAQPFARPVRGLILSGGTALCAGLDRYLQQALGIPVKMGEPLQHVDGADSLPHDVAVRAAVAIGLALDAPEQS